MRLAKLSKWLLILLLLPVQQGRAEGFSHIDWGNFLRDGMVPKVCQMVDLGPDWKERDYGIRIDYPEYEPLSSKEMAVVKAKGIEAGDTIGYQWSVGVSRKQGVGQVRIFPLICEGHKWKKLVSYHLTVFPRKNPSRFSLHAQTSSASRYASHSVLKDGRWVKIRVSDEGIYQITPSLLKKMGFSNINKIKVYGYGGRVQNMKIDYGVGDGDVDDLHEVPLYHRGEDVLFYANGTLRWTDWTYSSIYHRYICERQINPYSSYSYYFVTEGDSTLQVSVDSSLVRMTPTKTLTTYPEHLLIENDAYSWYTSGRNLYDSYNFSTGNNKTYTLPAAYADTSVTAFIRVCMTASSSTSTTMSLSLNGKKTDTGTISKCGQYDHATSVTRQFTTNILPGNNALNIQMTAGVDARLDNIVMCYDRKLQLSGDMLLFSHYLDDAACMSLSGADVSTRVWRIGNAEEPTCEIPATLSVGKLDFNVADAARRYVAFNSGAEFPSPEMVGKVANQDLHGDSLVDMVIVIPANGKLKGEAQRLADAHEQLNHMKVRIVRADQLYNEFSSGTPDAGAYRRYLKMLYDRDEAQVPTLRYLLLFGSCVWDNRMITSHTKGLSPDNYLLSFESENSINEVNSYVTDDFFGFLDDGEGGDIQGEKIDIGIGRFPVTTPDEAAVLVDKTIAYMANKAVGNWKNAVYMLGDDGDSNGHMKDAESVARMVESNYPSMLLKRIYWDAYPRVSSATGFTYPAVRTELQNIMKKGALVMNYSGHGAPYTLSHEQVLKLNDFKEFSSANVPMWVVASCELTPYDMLVEEIGTTSLLNRKGSAIAFYGASRAVYSELNRYLNKNYMNFLLGKDSEGHRYSIGDAARLTKVYLVDEEQSETDYSINKLKYTLLGDPALTLTMPTENVVLDEINGKKLEASSLVELKAGSVAKLKGHIESSRNEPLNRFHGMVSVTLQDSQDTITCKNNAKDEVGPYVYYEHAKTLYQCSDSVRNGMFEISVPIPLDLNYRNEPGRLNFYAANNDHTLEANGMDERIVLGGSEVPEPSDTLGPSLSVYLNDPDFEDGDDVNETPYFYALLSDSDGINITGNGLGHDLMLAIDGQEQYTYILNNYYENDFGSYTHGTVCYHIPTLPEGPHRLFFRAWDLQNHSSSTVLNFNVAPGMKPTLDVELSRNPAKTTTEFMITYDRPETETEFTVEVYDCLGHLCWKHSETGTSAGFYTIPWDLTTTSGCPLSAGLYLYKVSVACGGSPEVTKTKKMMIHRQ